MILLCLIAACGSADPQPAAPNGQTGPAPGVDRYLDSRFRLLPPRGFPDEQAAARACDGATSRAIREIEAGGAIVDPTYDETIVRNLECRRAFDDPRIAVCRFEQAAIPLQATLGPERESFVKRLGERDWTGAKARFALVERTDAAAGGGPQWIATDTCQSFVWRGEDWEVDLRDMVRNQPGK